jgi:transposase
MDVLYTHCCGIDVGKKEVVACLIVPGEDGRAKKTIRRFPTMTEDLEALAAWLRGAGCLQVAMESTGVYWQPVWNVLEEAGVFELLLVNARHVKIVPGRKTDVNDAEWLADLVRHGLVRGSYVPDRAQRELRELTRYRTELLEERTAHVNRLHKTLETANLKLGAVATDVLGVSCRAILAALVDPAQTATAEELANLARGRLRTKIADLRRALIGRLRPHHRFMLAELLVMIDALDERIDAVSAEIAERTRPFADDLARLDTIPGIGQRVAEIVVAGLGPDLSHFPSPTQLASWAGLCPGNHESAGKRKAGMTRSGNAALPRALVEAARAASRSRTYLRAQYYRLKARRGAQRAAVAVAHSIIRIIHFVLTRKTDYKDLGPDYFDRRDAAATERQLVTRLERLGNKVTIEKVA